MVSFRLSLLGRGSSVLCSVSRLVIAQANCIVVLYLPTGNSPTITIKSFAVKGEGFVARTVH